MMDHVNQTELLKTKVLRSLGMAQRAGRLASGEFMTEKEIQSFRATLVIVAEDASEQTKKKFRNKCEFYEIPFVCFSTMGELGRAIGKEQRASLALLDEGFTKAVLTKLDQIGVMQHEN